MKKTLVKSNVFEEICQELELVNDKGPTIGSFSIKKFSEAIESGRIRYYISDKNNSEEHLKSIIQKFRAQFPNHGDLTKDAFFNQGDARARIVAEMIKEGDFWSSLTSQDRAEIKEWESIPEEAINPVASE